MEAANRTHNNHQNDQKRPNHTGTFFKPVIQPKLSVNQPGDAYEHEADAMADKVVRMTTPPLNQNTFFKPVNNTLQRKCQHCEEEEKRLHRKEENGNDVQGGSELDNYVDSLSSSGHLMPESSRQFFEPRFGHDFSNVRVHTDAVAAKSAQSINALAYTSGNNIVFNSGQFSPESESGKRLMAHELTHTIQQSTGAGGIQRVCTPDAICHAPSIPGSAGGFGLSESAREAPARARRQRMTPARALSTSHAGHARQLETFLQAQTPGRLHSIQGIFIDQDMSPNTGALTENCSAWSDGSLPGGTIVPGTAGAVKECVFVHGNLNQEALQFNTTADATIGGLPRETWRVNTLQTLTHESQHAIFDTSRHRRPHGITTRGCNRTRLANELTELSAELSEFPIIFRAVPAGAVAGDPAIVRLNEWFNTTITSGQEGIRGLLQKMGCSCECSEVDAFVIDTFNFTARSWTAAEKTAFHTELNRPVWGMHWPIAP